MAASMRLPVVVVLGSTGTGKSKLALELGKIFKGEIISADSMQVYKGLDISTNKVTAEELRQCPHHMIDFLSPLTRNYTVTDYRDATLPIIDRLLKQEKLPIIVGGTSYYIESLLWNFIITKQDIEKALKEGQSPAKKTKLFQTEPPIELTSKVELSSFSFGNGQQAKESSSYVQGNRVLIPEEIQEPQINRDSENSDLDRKNITVKDKLKEYGDGTSLDWEKYNGVESDVLFARLQEVDPEMALMIHRNNRRKIIRRGLVDELQDFHQQYNADRLKEKSEPDYTQGIFQSIGFKEFHEYLVLSKEEQNTDKGRQLFKEGVENLKKRTRAYAKYQVKHIRNRYIKHQGGVYASDVSQWEDRVKTPAVEILTDILQGREPRHAPIHSEETDNYRVHEVCDICNDGRIFYTSQEWNRHLKSKRHERRKYKLKKEKASLLNSNKTKKEVTSEPGDEGDDSALPNSLSGEVRLMGDNSSQSDSGSGEVGSMGDNSSQLVSRSGEVRSMGDNSSVPHCGSGEVESMGDNSSQLVGGSEEVGSMGDNSSVPHCGSGEVGSMGDNSSMPD
ncbi:tRNA dimethylallyltransferase-like [Ylistrum balloti]|uniref:tRNA dimethylallyltransferase-like n=1 Tax=Ylistrum balloti TaxID=509963 RepID=UPI002905D59B|nr:tRNA dimethylallyltransferase-like [Ylistrum balloti]